tara:strand:- start:27110 stop:27799 length:690 start_codon:yes stop_codon:yes gene_type:complete
MTVKLRSFYETGNKVNDEPLVCVFENFLSDAEVEHLLLTAEPKLKQSLVSAEKSGVVSEGRSGSSCWIAQGFDTVVDGLSQRLADIVGVGLEHAESLQVIHYAQSEEYAPHFDAWDKATERGQRCMATGGQRMVSCLLYLNDVEEGGGTSFPNLDMEIRARKGRLVVFHNCHEGSTVRHPNSLHGGMPVLKGEKWACNFWFRELEYQQAPATVPAQSADTPSSKYSRVI